MWNFTLSRHQVLAQFSNAEKMLPKCKPVESESHNEPLVWINRLYCSNLFYLFSIGHDQSIPCWKTVSLFLRSERVTGHVHSFVYRWQTNKADSDWWLTLLNNSYEWFIYLFVCRALCRWRQIFANEFEWSADLFKLVFVCSVTRAFAIDLRRPVVSCWQWNWTHREECLQSSSRFPPKYTNWSNEWFHEFNLIVQWTRFSTNLVVSIVERPVACVFHALPGLHWLTVYGNDGNLYLAKFRFNRRNGTCNFLLDRMRILGLESSIKGEATMAVGYRSVDSFEIGEQMVVFSLDKFRIE